MTLRTNDAHFITCTVFIAPLEGKAATVSLCEGSSYQELMRTGVTANTSKEEASGECAERPEDQTALWLKACG